MTTMSSSKKGDGDAKNAEETEERVAGDAPSNIYLLVSGLFHYFAHFGETSQISYKKCSLVTAPLCNTECGVLLLLSVCCRPNVRRDVNSEERCHAGGLRCNVDRLVNIFVQLLGGKE